jgi:HD-GYP domain-containing protein (c-di-GMP phosphodiesterase class II)
VKESVRVLYVLRTDESHPPPLVLQAASSVHVIRAGVTADAPTRQFNPQVLCIREPFDRDARIALEKLADLHVPVLGIGDDGSPEGLSAQVSASILQEDLRTVLGLLVSMTQAYAHAVTVCHAEDAGQCIGRVNDDIVHLLEHMLSLRFPDYRERGERIFDTCLWIGSHLYLPPHEMKDLLRAARLREIGKLGIPDRIVFARRQDRSLDDQTTYNRYPELGARVLRELPALRNAAAIVEFQLENFDGSGPAGLMAHQIPLGSRVLRAAATFAQIVAAGDDRERGAQEAIAVLEKGRGSLYDPLLVKLVANFHSTRRESSANNERRWVRVADLAEGMTLAEDIWSRTGMKILPSGTLLTEHVLKLIRQFPLDPSLESVQILK